jgi:hypothetical protein
MVASFLRLGFRACFFPVMGACFFGPPARIGTRFIGGQTSKITAEACLESEATSAAEDAGKTLCEGKRVHHHEISVREGQKNDELVREAPPRKPS